MFRTLFYEAGTPCNNYAAYCVTSSKNFVKLIPQVNKSIVKFVKFWKFRIGEMMSWTVWCSGHVFKGWNCSRHCFTNSEFKIPKRVHKGFFWDRIRYLSFLKMSRSWSRRYELYVHDIHRLTNSEFPNFTNFSYSKTNLKWDRVYDPLAFFFKVFISFLTNRPNFSYDLAHIKLGIGKLSIIFTKIIFFNYSLIIRRILKFHKECWKHLV